MYVLIILICKLLSLILGLFKRGTAFPGDLALKMDKHILKKFSIPKNVIAVTGSSGKSSTSYMIYSILKSSGLKVAHNSKGSNLINGIASLLISNSNIFGRNKLDALVLEVDERYTKLLFDEIKPTTVVLSNITRDQPPRHGNYKKVYDVIKSALFNDALLIVNGDDPIVSTLAMNHDKCIYFGMCQNKDSFPSLISSCLDMVYCPVCHSKLSYNYVQFGNVGDYYCPCCDFKRPKLDFKVTSINDNCFDINNKYTIKTNYQMLYLYYNLLAAFACTSALGINDNIITSTLNNIELFNNRYNRYLIDGRNCEIINGKNENATSYNQAINYVRNCDGLKTIVFGFEYISLRYPYQDISWLYDIDFELLDNIDTFICVGDFAYDIALRASVAGIKNIKIIKNIDNVYNDVVGSKGDIFVIVNMGTEIPFLECLKKNGYDLK